MVLEGGGTGGGGVTGSAAGPHAQRNAAMAKKAENLVLRLEKDGSLCGIANIGCEGQSEAGIGYYEARRLARFSCGYSDE